MLDKLAIAAIPADMNANQGHTLHLMRDNRIRITDTADILYAAANEKTTLVYTPDGEFYVPYTISELMHNSPPTFSVATALIASTWIKSLKLHQD
ncbi:LytTR family transcriptional regulator DNA-binding domain-containing protein [Salinivibrio socompensis]|uniref:LytTR family transcriptional regulator DNA-binding domain-containing protein n=1 Tax=Salinivibrio socompensis TaxID=1510206 RepID=UPI00046E8C23|nr:LytTR family transcriptional regulator DNA-binding domain-containing protein [Salinivibrio socompensis]